MNFGELENLNDSELFDLQNKISEIVKQRNLKKGDLEEIIDNSFKHQGHKFFDKDKLHLKIIIDSKYLKSLKTVQAHKKVMEVLKGEIKEKIHALELKIN